MPIPLVMYKNNKLIKLKEILEPVLPSTYSHTVTYYGQIKD